MTALIEYKPQGYTLKQFHESEAWVRVIVGPLGSGKTRACLTEVIFQAAGQAPDAQGVRRSRIVICRNTYPDLQNTTIKDFKEMTETLNLGTFRNTTPPTWNCTQSLVDQTTMDVEVLFMAFDSADDQKKARGLQLSGLYMNELKELSKSNFDMLSSRVGRYPPKAQVPEARSFIIADSNAPDRDHWVAQLALEDTPKKWEFFIQPGGVVKVGGEWVLNPRGENINNLPDEYYERLVGGRKESWVRQNLANEFVFHTDGRPIHPDFNQSLHVHEVKAQPHLPLTIGIDFGRTPAATIGQKQHDGRWFILEEYATENMGARKFGQLLSSHINGNDGYQTCPLEFIGDPAGNAMAQTDDTTPFDMLRLSGIQAIPAPTNDFEERTGALDKLLSRLVGGEPAIVIDPGCKTLLRGLGGAYQFRRIQTVGEVYQDKPIKDMTSHTVESLHYMLIGAGEGPLQEARLKRRAETQKFIDELKREREASNYYAQFE